MKTNAVGWFEIYVEDMDRAKKFYESVLEVELEQLESPGIEMWVFPRDAEAPGIAGALVHMPGFPSGGNSTLVYFICEDCETEGHRIVDAGGRIQKEKFSIGEHGFIVLAFDTEGNMIGLHSMK